MFRIEDMTESSESLDTLANIDKQRRLSGMILINIYQYFSDFLHNSGYLFLINKQFFSAGSGGLPSIYTTPTKTRQNRYKHQILFVKTITEFGS